MTPTFVSIKKFVKNPLLYLDSVEHVDLVLTRKDRALYVLMNEERLFEYCRVMLQSVRAAHKHDFEILQDLKRKEKARTKAAATDTSDGTNGADVEGLDGSDGIGGSDEADEASDKETDERTNKDQPDD